MCGFAMNFLANELKNNVTKGKIKTALKGMCSKLPAHLNDEVKICNSYVFC